MRNALKKELMRNICLFQLIQACYHRKPALSKWQSVWARIKMVIQDLTLKYLPSPSGSSMLSQKSNPLEVTECVNEMKNGARGSDLVPLNVVKAILSFILPMLVEIANGFFNDETFPDIFKRARIVPLHRNGDKDVAVISNRYRLYLYFPEFKLAITEKQHSRSDRMCEQDEKWRQRIRLGTSKCC